MELLTEAQLDQIAKTFGLKKVKTFPVKDGVVIEDDQVWWHAETGPELVKVKEHKNNLSRYPLIYSIHKPKTKITYL